MSDPRTLEEAVEASRRIIAEYDRERDDPRNDDWPDNPDDDAFLEYADNRAYEVEENHVHVYVNVRLCRECGAQPRYYRDVEAVRPTGDVL